MRLFSNLYLPLPILSQTIASLSNSVPTSLFSFIVRLEMLQGILIHFHPYYFELKFFNSLESITMVKDTQPPGHILPAIYF